MKIIAPSAYLIFVSAFILMHVWRVNKKNFQVAQNAKLCCLKCGAFDPKFVAKLV